MAPGRPRSPAVDQSILEAALALLVEQGYGGMSMEGIASRAGVGKAAIYRRWPSKAAVIVDALRGHGPGGINVAGCRSTTPFSTASRRAKSHSANYLGRRCSG